MECFFDLCPGCELNVFEMYDMEKEEERIIHFLFMHGVLPCHIKCPKCNRTLEPTRKLFRCQKKNKKSKRICSYRITALKGSIFDNFKLSIGKASAIVRLYLSRTPPRLKYIQQHTRCSLKTIVQWTKLIRCVLVSWNEENFKKLGGEGEIVELDELKLDKKKSNKTEVADAAWIFGGIQRGTKNIFLQAVPDRSATTLIKIIKEKVEPGTVTITDLWPGYEQLQEEGYNHYKVNQSLNFVDPLTGAHIQNIVRLWREVRSHVPRFGRGRVFQDYLEECKFMLTVKEENRLHEFWKQAGKLYSGLPHEFGS